MASLHILSAFYLFATGIFNIHYVKISKESIAFCLLCLFSFFWQIGNFFLLTTQDQLEGLFFSKFCYAFIIFIPTILYHFLAIVCQSNKDIKFIYTSYVISFFLLIILITSDLFINGIYEYNWGYYPKSSYFHYIHILQTIIVILRALILPIKEIIQKNNKHSMSYYLCAIVIYVFSSLDYLANFGIDMQPIAAFFISISLTIINCGIIEGFILNTTIKNVKYYGHKIANTTRESLKSIDKMSSIIRDNFKDSKNIYNIDIRQDVASIPINNYKDGMMFLDLMSRSSKQGYNIINLIINNLGKEEIEISKIEKIEISKIIDNIILQYHLEDKDLDLIHCSIKRNFSFLGDRHLFTYVIFNLLKNALIYRGKIEIYTSQSNNYNLLFFRNYKSYIIESDINFIFNDSKNKNEFSLGLPFCKKIMNKFNGDIECSSRKEGQEKWTEFKLSFPVIK
jgi:hypothetical protein